MTMRSLRGQCSAYSDVESLYDKANREHSNELCNTTEASRLTLTD